MDYSLAKSIILYTTFGVSFLTVLVQILASTNELRRTDPILTDVKKITRAGYWFYICSFILIFLPPVQNKLQESVQKSEQDHRDSILKEGYDASIKIIVDTLASYGFKAETENGELKRLIRDTKNNTVLPVLTLDQNNAITLNKIDETNYDFILNFFSYQAGCSQIDMQIFAVVQDYNGRLYYAGRRPRVSSNYVLPENSVVERPVHIITENFNMIKNAYFWAKGSYKSVDGSKTRPLDDIYIYSKERPIMQVAVGNLRERIVAVVKKNVNIR